MKRSLRLLSIVSVSVMLYTACFMLIGCGDDKTIGAAATPVIEEQKKALV